MTSVNGKILGSDSSLVWN